MARIVIAGVLLVFPASAYSIRGRIQTLNHLDTLTPEIVDAARETLIIGH